MIRKLFEGAMFAALVLVGWIWVVGWASNAFGQAVGRDGPATGTGYPSASEPVSAASTGTTGGTVAQITGLVGQYSYICGFNASIGSAAAVITIGVVVNGLPQQQTYFSEAPVTAAGVTGPIVSQTFFPCLRSSATNTNIQVIAGALGTGGVNQAVNVWGYTLPAN